MREVEVAVVPDLSVVYSDRVQPGGAFENLAEKAAKFMGEQPTPQVEVGARREGAASVLCTCAIMASALRRAIGEDPWDV